MLRIAPAVAALAVLAAPSAADILPAGTRPIEHTLVIEPSEHFEGLELYAFPTRGFGSETRIRPGEPFTFSSKYGTRIYAFAEGTAPAEFEGNPKALRDVPLVGAWTASGDIPVREEAFVPVASPVESVRTRLRIASIEGGAIRLETVETDVGWSTAIVAAAGAAAALGIAGLAVLVRRRRRAAAARA